MSLVPRGLIRAVVFLSAMTIRSALAQVGGGYCEDHPNAAGCPGHPAQSASASKVVTVIQPRNSTDLDPTRTYLVTITCKDHGTLPVGTIEGLVRQNVAASFLIAISDTNMPVFPTAASAKAYTAVYVIGGDTASRSSYVNTACNTQFFLTARRPLYLLANASRVSTNEAGTGLKLIEQGLSVISSIWPLFTGLPVPTRQNTEFTAVKNASGPIDQVISTFNRGAGDTKPYLLKAGKNPKKDTYTIRADYATVTVIVSPLLSIVGLDNKTFTAEFEDAVSQVFATNLTPNQTSDQVEAPCRGISNRLAALGFSSLDTTYALAYIAKNTGFGAETIIHCLGRDRALEAVQFASHWQEASQKFDADAVKTVFTAGDLTPPQPPFTQTVQSTLESAMGAMRDYVAKSSPTDDDAKALSAFLSPTLQVLDSSGTLTRPPGASPTESYSIRNVELVQQLSQNGYKKFGCLYHDSTSLAMFLAVPESGTQKGKYQITDALLLRLWLNSSRQISRLKISFDGGDIGAVIKAKNNVCGKTVAFGAPPDQKQDAHASLPFGP